VGLQFLGADDFSFPFEIHGFPIEAFERGHEDSGEGTDDGYEQYVVCPFGCIPSDGNRFGSLPVGWGGIGRRAGVSADAAPVAGVIRC